MALTVERITTAPSIEIVPVPQLPPDLAAVVAAAERRIDVDPRLFNGPQLMAVRYEPGRLFAYEGRYAHMLAAHDVGPGTALGIGAVGVGVLVTDTSGHELWSLRADTILHGGTWCFAAAGGVVPGQDFRSAGLGELLEELWIPETALISFEPQLLILGMFNTTYVIWRALVEPGVELRPNPEEVADVRWVTDPLAELCPILPFGAEICQLMRDMASLPD